MKTLKNLLALFAGILLAFAANAALVTGKTGDTIWSENGVAPAVPAQFEGDLVLDGTTMVFSLGDLSPFSVGGTVTFGAPSVKLTGELGSQLGSVFNAAVSFCGGATASLAPQHCSEMALAMKEVFGDLNVAKVYDIVAGLFKADSGGTKYDGGIFGLIAAEDVVNADLNGALKFAAVDVWITDDKWLSLVPLSSETPPSGPTTGVPEPTTASLALVAVAAMAMRRRKSA